MPSDLLLEISMAGGYFTQEMLVDEEIYPYYERFISDYFSQRMSDANKSRLETDAEKATLVIASLNRRELIMRLLESSGIQDLFSTIFSLEDSVDKKWMLRSACTGYDPKRDVTFVTDTIFDIQIAKELYPEMDIEAVDSGMETRRGLRGFVTEDKIIAPFY